MPRLLLAEDDSELRDVLVQLLTGEGYEVVAVRDGMAAVQTALNDAFDIAVLDRGLPFVEGLDVLARLRRVGWTVPVLILSAYGSARDRVAGLDAGAEDYLPKPFDVDELLARLRARLRTPLADVELLPTRAGRLDLAACVVRRADGAVVELSGREAALLAALAARPGQVHTRAELLHRVFEDAGSDSAVDTYVHYLRRKLGRDVIRTVTGRGYQLGALERA